MKKFCLLVICNILLLCLCACDSSHTEVSTQEGEERQVQQSENVTSKKSKKSKKKKNKANKKKQSSKAVNTKKKSGKITKANKKKYNVEIDIECIKNLMFSKYDINVIVDDCPLGTIKHGTDDIYELELVEGEHILRVEKKGNSNVYGALTLIIREDTVYEFKVYCTKDKISFEEAEADTADVTQDDQVIEVSGLINKKLKSIVKEFDGFDIGYSDYENYEIMFNGPEGTTALYGYDVYSNGRMSGVSIEEDFGNPYYSLYGIMYGMKRKKVEKLIPGDFLQEDTYMLYYFDFTHNGYDIDELYYSEKRKQFLSIDYDSDGDGEYLNYICCMDVSVLEE